MLIYPVSAYPVQCHGGLEPIPACTGGEADRQITLTFGGNRHYEHEYSDILLE